MTRNRRSLAIAIAVLLAAQIGAAVTATAQDPKTQEMPLTVWSVPGASGLDAIGAFFAATAVPAPVAGQSAENRWEHALVFQFAGAEDPFGTVSLDTDGTDRLVSIALNDGNGGVSEERYPFDWEAGRLYFVFALMLPGNVVAGYVYDVDAEAFTFIGAVRAQGSWGRLSGDSWTMTRWYGDDQEDCADYTRTDTYWSKPYGFLPGNPDPQPSTALGNFVVPGDCPATVTDEPDPDMFRHYQAGSSTAPTTTTSSSTTTEPSTTTTEVTLLPTVPTTLLPTTTTTSSSTTTTEPSTTTTTIP